MFEPCGEGEEGCSGMVEKDSGRLERCAALLLGMRMPGRTGRDEARFGIWAGGEGMEGAWGMRCEVAAVEGSGGLRVVGIGIDASGGMDERRLGGMGGVDRS